MSCESKQSARNRQRAITQAPCTLISGSGSLDWRTFLQVLLSLTHVHCYRRLWKKHSSGADPWETHLEQHHIRVWRAVSAAGLHGQGSYERNAFVRRHRYYGNMPTSVQRLGRRLFPRGSRLAATTLFVTPKRGYALASGRDKGLNGFTLVGVKIGTSRSFCSAQNTQLCALLLSSVMFPEAVVPT